MEKGNANSFLDSRNIWEALCEGQSHSIAGLSFLESDAEQVWEPAMVLSESLRYARGLKERGVERGSRVGILGHTCPEIAFTFLGCWALGAVPVPLPLPARALAPDAYTAQTQQRLRKVAALLCIVPVAFMPLLGELDAGCPVVAGEQLRATSMLEADNVSGHNDVALIQFTSGSTSNPKGVTLTHGMILANASAMTQTVMARPDDVLVSWLPIYHDMGLIGFFLAALMSGASVCLISPQNFLRKPSLWLEAISAKRATLSGAPNFAYSLATRILNGKGAPSFDLSSLRLLLNGAEPIDHQVLERFLEAGRPFGLRPEVVCPVYGMAESTLGVSFCQPGQKYIVDWVSLAALEQRGEAREAHPYGEGATGFVALGKPLPGVELRICVRGTRPAAERQVGEIHVKGSSLMAGYWQDQEATYRAVPDGWLRTGDLGYLAGGNLHIVGRSKDMIIVGGRNIFPEDAERCAEGILGLRKGNAIAFGISAANGREKMVLVSETREEPGPEADEIARLATCRVRNELDIPLQETVLVRPGTIPKTSSGKKQRYLCREAYLAGKLAAIARYGARQHVQELRAAPLTP